jgi:hypothetical protein
MEIIIKPHHKYSHIPIYIHGHYNKTDIGRAINSRQHIGQISSMKGKHHTEEANKKNSDAHKDKPSWNKGIKCPQISIALMGEKHPNWRGGYKLKCARACRKHRQLGFNPINEPLHIDDEVAHHVTTEYVVYVPEYLNKSFAHNIHTRKNMDEVNFFVLNYLILIYNKEV